MNKILCFIYGIVTFRVVDYDILRINRLRRFVPFNVKCEYGITTFSVRLKHARATRRTLNGFEYTEYENVNLSRGVRYLSSRVALCIIIALCGLLYFLSDCFVYNIRVVGGEDELNVSVENYLQRMGVTRYSLKMKVDAGKIANNVVFNFDNIAHANVRLRGSTLVVSILSAEVNNDIDKIQLGNYIVTDV